MALLYDDSINRLKKQIEHIREYRTRLIADIVTGKLDVHEAAFRLPDEFTEADPLDEIDTLTDEDLIEDTDAVEDVE